MDNDKIQLDAEAWISGGRVYVKIHAPRGLADEMIHLVYAHLNTPLKMDVASFWFSADTNGIVLVTPESNKKTFEG